MNALTSPTKTCTKLNITKISPVISSILFILIGLMANTCQAFSYKLTADDSDVFDQFGRAVAIDGNTILVGAANHAEDLSDDGAVYLFNREGSTWQPASRLMPLDPGWNSRHFGYAVDLDANTAVIGAPWASGGGSAYIFQYDGVEWYQEARLIANDANDDFRCFGGAVAIDGNTVVIGAKYDNQEAENSGAAYVFEREDSIWTQQAKLKPRDTASDQWFGYSVAIDANTVVVGAHSVGQNSKSGWAYIYQRDNASWAEKARLTESDSSDCVAINNRTVVVGNKWDWNVGVHTYEDISEEGDWSLMHTTTMTGMPGDFFGSSVALDANTLLIGAEDAEGIDSLSGTVTIYRRKALSWIQDKQLVADDGQWGDQFGCSVAISSGTIVVGAQDADGGSEYSGAAYVFDNDQPQDNNSTSSQWVLCAVDYYGKFIRIDPHSYDIEIIRTDLPNHLQALATSPEGILYTATNTGQLYVIDPITGDSELARNLDMDIRSMAFGPSGELYLTSNITQQPTAATLWKVDLEHGTLLQIGTLTGEGNSAQGLDFYQGVLYGIDPVGTGSYGLYTIEQNSSHMYQIAQMDANGIDQSLVFTPDDSLYAIGGHEFCQLDPNDGTLIGTPITIPGDFRGLEVISTAGFGNETNRNSFIQAR